MVDELRINKKLIIILVGFLLTVAFAAFLFMPRTNISFSDNSNLNDNGGVKTAKVISNINVQDIYLKAFAGGYDKYEIKVKKEVPVRLHFTAENAGCGSYLVIYGLGVTAISKNNQEAVVEFTPDKEGTYTYSCGMRMFPPGKFVVAA